MHQNSAQVGALDRLHVPHQRRMQNAEGCVNEALEDFIFGGAFAHVGKDECVARSVWAWKLLLHQV